jgi:hypothetical protein
VLVEILLYAQLLFLPLRGGDVPEHLVKVMMVVMPVALMQAQVPPAPGAGAEAQEETGAMGARSVVTGMVAKAE